MALTDTVNINFQIFSVGDPKLLIVMDASIWGMIEEEPSIIEITPPNTTKTIVHYYEKGKNNIFNSSNLLLSPIEEINDLPDGVWKIAVKGSPSDLYCMERDYLKTDGVILELDRLYINLGLDDTDEVKKQRGIILEIESTIKSAEAHIRQGKSVKGANLFKRAAQQLIRYNDCENC